jgi:mitochondrial import receptor subunit TOM70
MKLKTPSLPSETFIGAYMDSFRCKPSALDDILAVESEAASTLKLQSAAKDMQAREWQSAYDNVNAAIDADEWDSPFTQSKALNIRATFSFLIGSTDAAVKYIDASLLLDANNVNTLIKRATLFMEKGEVAETIAQFERAAAIDADNVDMYYHRYIQLTQGSSSFPYR